MLRGADFRPTSVPGEYAWEATELSAGRTRLTLGGLQLTQIIEISPGGLHGVRVVAPELCEVVAREPGSESERALRMEFLPPRDELGTVRFRAPVGRIALGSGLDGYDEDGGWFDLESGTNEIELSLEARWSSPSPSTVARCASHQASAQRSRSSSCRCTERDRELPPMLQYLFTSGGP